ncbi:DUF1385 domain-containing protein [soil metagenome]
MRGQEQRHTNKGPIGGQALLDGVMMRCGQRWGAAVRRSDGSIATVTHDLPALDGLRRWPLVRGVLALGESTVLGTRAMVWAAGERAVPRPDADRARGVGLGDAPGSRPSGYSRVGLALAVVAAVVLAVGLFGLAPAALAKLSGVEGTVRFNLVETGVRLGLLVGYLSLLGRSAEVQRVFGYHGAEHMTIHAHERGDPLEPASIRSHDRRHPRCGTSFLLMVVAVTLVVHLLVGTPGWGSLLASRVLLLPVVAGLSYEVVKAAGTHHQRRWARVAMAPGAWLQSVTTRPPDDGQIEVAIAALRAAAPVAASGFGESRVVASGGVH